MSTNEQLNQLETKSVASLLWKYSIPAVIGTLSIAIYNIVDRIFIGQGVGAMAISGLALTFPIMTLFQAFGTLVGVGASARISIVLGLKDKPWAQRILGNSLILTLIFWAVLSFFGLLYLDPLLIAFGGSSQTISYARDYLLIVIPATIFSNLSFSFSNIMRASGYPQKAMITLLIGVFFNVILDPIFIFTLNMGIQGAAIATAVSMFISACFAMYHFIDKKNVIHFTRPAFRLKASIIRNITAIGLSPFLMNLVAAGINVFINNLLVKEGGDLAIGAWGIVSTFGTMFVMLVIGICQGMQPIVGYNYGAKNVKRVKDTLLLTLRVGIITTSICFILSLAAPGAIVRVFTHDEELIRITTKAFRYVFWIFPLVGFQIVLANFFQSISKPAISIFMSLSRQVLFLIPALFIMSHYWGLTGIWLASPISDFLSVTVAFGVLIRQKRLFYPDAAQRQRRRKKI